MRYGILTLVLLGCAGSPKVPFLDAGGSEICYAPPLSSVECVARLKYAAELDDLPMDVNWDGKIGGPDFRRCANLPERNTTPHRETCPPLSREECLARVQAAFTEPADRDSAIDLSGDGIIGGPDFTRCPGPSEE